LVAISGGRPWPGAARWPGVSRSADGTHGVAAPLAADLPTRIPFRNTAFPGGPIAIDFPALVANWATFGVTPTGVLGTADATIQARDQDMAALTVGGPGFVRVPPGEFTASQVYTIGLPNLAPDSSALAWQLWSSIDNVTRHDTLDVGAFAQSAFLDVDFPMPLHVPPGTYRFVLSVSAIETCGTDPAKTLSAAASRELHVQVPKHVPVQSPHPEPGLAER
jgi:hypothetical protein